MRGGSRALGARGSGHGAAEAGPHHPRQLTRDVWCAARAGRAQAEGDKHGRKRIARLMRAAGWSAPAAGARGDDHAAGQGCPTRP